MPSGRVPMKTSTVLGLSICVRTELSPLRDPRPGAQAENLARGKPQELSVRMQVTFPHLPRLHCQSPRPFHPEVLKHTRCSAHVPGQHIERPTDTHDHGNPEGF